MIQADPKAANLVTKRQSSAWGLSTALESSHTNRTLVPAHVATPATPRSVSIRSDGELVVVLAVAQRQLAPALQPYKPS